MALPEMNPPQKGRVALASNAACTHACRYMVDAVAHVLLILRCEILDEMNVAGERDIWSESGSSLGDGYGSSVGCALR